MRVPAAVVRSLGRNFACKRRLDGNARLARFQSFLRPSGMQLNYP